MPARARVMPESRAELDRSPNPTTPTSRMTTSLKWPRTCGGRIEQIRSSLTRAYALGVQHVRYTKLLSSATAACSYDVSHTVVDTETDPLHACGLSDRVISGPDPSTGEVVIWH